MDIKITIIIPDFLCAIVLSIIFFKAISHFYRNLLKKHINVASKGVFSIINAEFLAQASTFKGKLYIPIVFIQCLYFIVAFLHILEVTPVLDAIIIQCFLTFLFSFIVFIDNVYLSLFKREFNLNNIFLLTNNLSVFTYKKLLITTSIVIRNIIIITIMAELSLYVIWLFLFCIGGDTVIINVYIFCLIIKFLVCAIEAFSFAVNFCSYLDNIDFINK